MKRLVMVTLALLVPAAAHAQEVAAVHPGVKIDALPTAYVLDDKGVETRGRLLKLNGDAVVLLVDGAERRFDMARVRRIDKRGDSLKNGAVAGAVAGVLMGSLSMWLADCPGRDNSCAGAKVAGITLSTAFYTVVGTGIDAMVQGRTNLYQAPPAPMAAQSARRAAVGLRISW